MAMLNKTGVRSPFLQAPLQGPNDPIRPAIVVAAIVPMVLLAGQVKFTSRPALPEDVTKPTPPAIVVTIPQPTIPAIVWQTKLPFAVNPVDRLSPTILVQDAPDGTLVQSRTQFTSRPAIVEDIQWPAHPAQAIVNQQIIPAAQSTQTYAPRDQVAVNTDPVRRAFVVQDAPDGTLVLANAQFTSRPAPPEDITKPSRPAVVFVGQQPVPLAQSILAYAPRDAAPSTPRSPVVILGQQIYPPANAVQTRLPFNSFDRLSPTIIIDEPSPQIRLTSGWAQSTGRPLQDDSRLAITGVIVGPQAPPTRAIILVTGQRALQASTDRPAITQAWVGQVIYPGATFVLTRAPLVPAIALLIGSIKGPAPHGSVLSPQQTGTLKGPPINGSIVG